MNDLDIRPEIIKEDEFNPRKIKPVEREVVLNIEKFANEGCSIAHENDKVIFVRYAIPGEIVRAKVYKETSSYAMAEPVEIIKASPLRVNPECPYFSLCGGCDYQMMNYKKQVEVKFSLLIETFRWIAGLDVENMLEVIESPLVFGYRNTETFKVNPKTRKIGFFRRDTKSVVDIEKCLLAMDKINQALKDVRNQKEFPPHNFKVRATNDGDVVVNFIKTEKYEDRPVYERITVFGKSVRFKISKDSFFQVNNSVIPLWLEKIVEFLDSNGSEVVYDLYCGIGLITIFVSLFAKKTIGIEIAKSSVNDAIHNVEINNIQTNISFIQAAVEEKIGKLKPADVYIIDPPRKGMTDDCISVLRKYRPKKIIYSSCKATTMARDISKLIDLYDLKRLALVDMFPQTHHVETLALLVAKE